ASCLTRTHAPEEDFTDSVEWGAVEWSAWASAFACEARQDRSRRNRKHSSIVLTPLRPERSRVRNHCGVVCAGTKIRYYESHPLGLAQHGSSLAQATVC